MGFYGTLKMIFYKVSRISAGDYPPVSPLTHLPSRFIRVRFPSSCLSLTRLSGQISPLLRRMRSGVTAPRRRRFNCACIYVVPPPYNGAALEWNVVIRRTMPSLQLHLFKESPLLCDLQMRLLLWHIWQFNSATLDENLFIFLMLCALKVLAGGPDFASVSASFSLHLYSSSPPILLHALPATPIWPVCVWNVHILTSLLRPGLAIPPLWSSLLFRFIMILCYAAVVYDQRSCTSLRVIRLPSPVEGVCPLTLCSGLRLQPQIMGHCVRLQEVEYPQGCSLYHAERQP